MKQRHQLFFDIACSAALESKYDGTKVGCVVVKEGRPISIGWNGYPTGADDDGINQMVRDDRLQLAIHAEENAILNAALHGNSVKDATVYVTHKPCTSCLSKLSNAGVKQVFHVFNPGFEAAWCSPNREVYSKIPLYKKVSRIAMKVLRPHTREIYTTLDKYQIQE
ncbi:putative dCMP deaminase [Rhizobium phage vB_RleM_P10VF]|uniref:dCMP deaminase n=2 Tax=Innesvirus TaxID=3044739 RepID=A0A7G7WW54_9CAUD|nr:putative dCMP deaminase [Rhizobium phage vB_RleM_P10VF]YP_010662196.1 dCMP deaminase [Rhizobium phage AF3]AIK68228.1 putative dCMP deaminase [Rhizobium phage vB_RleM_P10VF]QNH71448.1 dCMP deaminase [Rhizobium phage AF3]